MNKNNNFKYFYYIDFTLDADIYQALYKDTHNKDCSENELNQFILECFTNELNSFNDDLQNYTYVNEPSVVTCETKTNNPEIISVYDNLSAALQSHLSGVKACVVKHVNDHFELTVTTAEHDTSVYNIMPFANNHTYELKTNKRKKKHGNTENF